METSKVVRIDQKARSGRRANNFNLVRFLAAVLVFAGHMGMVLNLIPPRFGSFALHEIGVAVLFLVGGYLISQSWQADPDPLRYGIRRFFRLWPPFAVLILVMVFVSGPLLSSFGVAGYFSSWYRIYLRNLRFLIVFAQPGVFADVPYANVTNGSLWTMPVEAGLYVLTPLILTLVGRIGKREHSFRRMGILTALLMAFDLYLRICQEGRTVIVYGTDLISAYHLAVFFFIGMLYAHKEMKRWLNLQYGCVGMLVLLLFQFAGTPLQYLLLYLILPYFVFAIALAPEARFASFGQKLELSYGIYLYGFFFQQLIMQIRTQHGYNWGYTKCLLLSALPTLGAAVLSCKLVEQPCQRLSRRLIGYAREHQGRKKSA